jgi:hypothetical protein
MSVALQGIIITPDSSTQKIQKDSITDRQYYYLSNSDQLDKLISSNSVNTNQILLASFNGQIRFLLNDEALVIVEGQTFEQVRNHFPIDAINNMTFYLGDGHAAIGFNCGKCDEGNSHNKFYDLISKVGESDTLFYSESSPNYIMAGPNITFFLSDHQANTIFSTLTYLHNESERGNYKYINVIHDCVSFLTDVYKQSGFPYHFSSYFMDEELLSLPDSSTTITAYVHRFLLYRELC